LPAGTASGTTAGGQELDVIEHNLKFVSRLCPLRLFFPSIRSLSRPSTIAGLPLVEILGDQFTLLAPCFDINEGRFIAGRTRLILKLAIYRQAKLADGSALRRDPEFGITRQISDEERLSSREAMGQRGGPACA